MDTAVRIAGHTYVCMLTVSSTGVIIYKREERKRISVKTAIQERISSNCNKRK